MVSVSQMERDIMNGEIIEHAVLHGHYYGTSINAIRRVINSGRTCLLILDPQAIKLVRTAELRPFIVYFTTPTGEFMKKNWLPSKKVKVRCGVNWRLINPFPPPGISSAGYCAPCHSLGEELHALF